MQNYFFIDKHNKQQGPISPSRMAECGVTPTTLVWCSGMSDWAPASSIAELQDYLCAAEPSSSTPPPPFGDRANGNMGGNNGQEMYTQPHPQSQRPPYPCPDTHLVPAIIVTLCCCLPFGIVAIVKSCQVSTLYAQGNYDAALITSADAQKWVIWAVVCGIFSWFIFAGLRMLPIF